MPSPLSFFFLNFPSGPSKQTFSLCPWKKCFTTKIHRSTCYFFCGGKKCKKMLGTWLVNFELIPYITVMKKLFWVLKMKKHHYLPHYLQHFGDYLDSQPIEWKILEFYEQVTHATDVKWGSCYNECQYKLKIFPAKVRSTVLLLSAWTTHWLCWTE